MTVKSINELSREEISELINTYTTILTDCDGECAQHYSFSDYITTENSNINTVLMVTMVISCDFFMFKIT